MLVCAAKKLSAGQSILTSGHVPVRVLAAIPISDAAVAILTESGERVERVNTLGDDGIRVAGSARRAAAVDHEAIEALHRWHDDRGAQCCGESGPFCEASVRFAYRHVCNVIGNRHTKIGRPSSDGGGS